MRYEVGVNCDGIKEYELFFKDAVHAEVAELVAQEAIIKYHFVYDVTTFDADYDDYRVYIVCDNITLHNILEDINYALKDYCVDGDEDVDWEWL